MRHHEGPAPEPTPESDGSYCLLEYVESSDSSNSQPSTIICFHGSGANHLRSWRGLLESLRPQHQVVFFERGLQNPAPDEHIKVLWAFLEKSSLNSPYILVAHSYGGLFAKHFAHAHPRSVGGMVLVETGKGSSTDGTRIPIVKKAGLGRKPLSVIRANSFLKQQHELEAGVGTGSSNDTHKVKQEWLAKCMAEDEKLETDQLRLSSNSRLIHLPDCGHNVVVDRPEVVLQEIQRVVEQSHSSRSSPSWFTSIKGLFSTVMMD